MTNHPKLTFTGAIHKWCDGKMSARSSYYSGRGPNSSDLNSDHLEMIYDGIKNDFGKDQAEVFVRFVRNLTDMSATNFLVEFERLFNNDFKYRKPNPSHPTKGAITSHDDEGKMVEGFAFIGAMMGRNSTPEMDEMLSKSIKRGFLRNHGVKPTPWTSIDGSVEYDYQ